MSCSRGQANPDTQTKLRLFADSGGYCQRPDCANRLFVDTGSKNIHLAEMAHIIAASGDGPRGDASVSQEDKGAYGNLILLCANCHTMVDKVPEDFPDALMQDWKRKHVERIAALFGAFEYSDRATARKALEPALAENRAIFEKYGPDNDYRENPESDDAKAWQRKMRSIILPNNRKVLAILDANRRHLNKGESGVLEAFRQHVDDLEVKHLGEGGNVAQRFPNGMNKILLEEASGS
ncbi:HNH endonuclease [Bradyrhizobium sp. G127]|uniref:HNH endonuclease n=1 Tax=Bradyrhizobium sp. G127 TaxID=2904800 RepID=UPI001F233841|nr:HNH endonuclease [Bradyrhizobium sp. G127]MCF2523624.1 HNH endonuclease [Bradyrhizobium sp. G127]